ncbi:MAG TPA: hypothetical protein VI279_06855 [Rhodocyclaceae bacterium]
MTRTQWIILSAALFNLALVLLFPPYDYLSMQRGNVPTFSGFHFPFVELPHLVLNKDFLTLEVFVILVNTAIAWLLVGKPATKARAKGLSQGQRRLLWFIGLNLVAMLLFPPFENYKAISRAALPTFDGFYFIFGDNSQRQIVTTILYIELALVLINGGLIWLFLKDKEPEQLTPEQIKALAERLRREQQKH